MCQYLRTPEQCSQCINQDPNLRGEVSSSDFYAEAPVFDFSTAPGGGGDQPGAL